MLGICSRSADCMHQEHGPPPQGCTWEAHRKWAPALPILAMIIQHMDEHFHDFYRSRKHYVPDPEEDITLLMKRHAERRIHLETNQDQVTTPEKRLHDCFITGRTKIVDKKYLDAVARERIEYFSNLSLLEIAEHDDITIEDAIQLKRREGIKDNNNSVRNNTEGGLDELGEENDEDLLYGYTETSEEDLDGLETIRQRLGDGLEG